MDQTKENSTKASQPIGKFQRNKVGFGSSYKQLAVSVPLPIMANLMVAIY